MPEPENISVIDFFCGITLKSARALVSVVNNAVHNNPAKIVIRLSSTGGSLDPAFAAYHFLRAAGAPLEIYNAGNVQSSAVLLYLAADTRCAAPHSRFLFHNFHWAFGGEPVIHSSLREKIFNLDFDAARYCDIFNERTQGAKSPVNIVEALKGNAVIVSAATAIEAGVCSAIAEPAVPAGADLWWVKAGYVS